MKRKQLSIFVENKTGRINEVTRILAKNGINMLAISVAEGSDFGILRIIVSDTDLAEKVLKEANFATMITEVVTVHCPNQSGALAAVLDRLASSDIFIKYLYAFAQDNIIAICTDNNDKSVEILRK